MGRRLGRHCIRRSVGASYRRRLLHPGLLARTTALQPPPHPCASTRNRSVPRTPTLRLNYQRYWPRPYATIFGTGVSPCQEHPNPVWTHLRDRPHRSHSRVANLNSNANNPFFSSRGHPRSTRLFMNPPFFVCPNIINANSRFYGLWQIATLASIAHLHQIFLFPYDIRCTSPEFAPSGQYMESIAWFYEYTLSRRPSSEKTYPTCMFLGSCNKL